MKRIICLYGGPGSGKSTTCAGIFYKLKYDGFNVEMNREYVKEWCWEGREIKPGDQTYFFAKQSRRERAYMREGLDFIVTDSPLILTHFYGQKYDPFEQEYNTSLKMLEQHAAICRHHGYKVDHYLIKRVKPYNPAGRYQTEQEAKQYDVEIEHMLQSLGIEYKIVEGVDDILKEYA